MAMSDVTVTHYLTLFFVLIDIVVSVTNALNLLSVFIGDLNTEFLFKTHHQFYSVQRVGTKVVDEPCVRCYFIFVHSELVDDDLLYLILDLLIGHFVCSSVSFLRPFFQAFSLARAASKLAESSTLRQFASRLICRISPDNTFPGPTSTKVFTPCSNNNSIDSSQRTGAETWRNNASRSSAGLVVALASTFVTTGTPASLNASCSSSKDKRSWAGFISAQWNGALTFSLITRFATSFNNSIARSTAATSPAITT